MICWAIWHVWFVQHLTRGILCQKLKELVFCLERRLRPEWTRDLSSQSVIQIRLHSGALVPNCHPELYSIYQIHPVEEFRLFIRSERSLRNTSSLNARLSSHYIFNDASKCTNMLPIQNLPICLELLKDITGRLRGQPQREGLGSFGDDILRHTASFSCTMVPVAHL